MESRKWPVVPATLAMVGGATIVAGCLLTWLDVTGGVSVGSVVVTGTPQGTDLLFGKVVLGTGIAELVFGFLLLAIRRARRLLGILLVVGGILAIATGVYVAFSPTDTYVDFAAAKAAPDGQLDEVTSSLTRLFEASDLRAHPGVGLYIVMAGGFVSVLGGVTALLGRRASSGVTGGVPSASEPFPVVSGTEDLALQPDEPARESGAETEAFVASEEAPAHLADAQAEELAEHKVPTEDVEPPEDVKPSDLEVGFHSDESWSAAQGSTKQRRQGSRWRRRKQH
jgi:hypothetical protein